MKSFLSKPLFRWLAALAAVVAISFGVATFVVEQRTDPDSVIRILDRDVSYPEPPSVFEDGLTVALIGAGLSESRCSGDGVALTVRVQHRVSQHLIVTDAGPGIQPGMVCSRSGDAGQDTWTPWRVGGGG